MEVVFSTFSHMFTLLLQYIYYLYYLCIHNYVYSVVYYYYSIIGEAKKGGDLIMRRE